MLLIPIPHAQTTEDTKYWKASSRLRSMCEAKCYVPLECNGSVQGSGMGPTFGAAYMHPEKQHILEGTKYTIEILNNHRKLTYFQTSQNLNCWKAHWSLFLSRFDFSLTHRTR